MNRDIRICYIGDSMVNGTGDTACLGWTGRLSQRLRQSGLNTSPTTTWEYVVRRLVD